MEIVLFKLANIQLIIMRHFGYSLLKHQLIIILAVEQRHHAD